MHAQMHRGKVLRLVLMVVVAFKRWLETWNCTKCLHEICGWLDFQVFSYLSVITRKNETEGK